jgi:hypothetical protein
VGKRINLNRPTVSDILATVPAEQLREELRSRRKRGPSLGGAASAPFAFKASPEAKRRYEAEARGEGFKTLSAFVRDTMADPRWYPAKAPPVAPRASPGTAERLVFVTLRLPNELREAWTGLAYERGFDDASAFVRASLERRCGF